MVLLARLWRNGNALRADDVDDQGLGEQRFDEPAGVEELLQVAP